jgi:glucokinase
MTLFAGIDLGGTKIAAGILDTDTGQLIAHDVQPTHAHEGADAVITRMADIVRGLVERSGVSLSGVGVGVPAVVDYEGGRTLLMPNLTKDWYGKPVVAQLQSALDLPVSIINDARAFTLAEATLGAGRGASTCVCFTVGTGIGGGIALDGRLHFGLKGAAGEFGHQTVEPAGPRCGCGNHGCLEAVASGSAITAQAVQVAGSQPEGVLSQLAGGDLSRMTPGVVMQAAEAGDIEAQNILQRAGTYLGIGIANVLTILSADCVVIGGGVSQLGDWLLNPVRAAVRSRCHTVALDEVQIVQAGLDRTRA